ncbi:hypothetical protein ESY86_07230 [Subsaximicrobium wynnwilliamsii]|uniref:Uncharacterized protein n=1 Tax=Subsaximicrobium wynnwilliamsii TaxID=291179 RepID=A0A5C6ZJR4_9FLAO|nr:hypothetical protein [Subsaximicrobium wynnwilliamsii]TXD83830.1 hypothetical protein ESY87_07390 [Subsaximicrobium wynnwilliamsii]TXD89571.1 hypothetical protein ESY86_07230 [Subsaximicrobium wynnwilliamsii]TXE02638.1 hypothetical protein ESY88_11615 [Subsaximicrobium wynnwilliamsii]
MRLKTLFYISLTVFLFNCQEAKVSQEKKETQAEIEARTIGPKDIEALEYTEFSLSQDAKKTVTDWQKYKDLNVQVLLLKSADFSFFNDDRTNVLTFIKDLKAEMPKAIRTKPIEARFSALDTKLQKLNSTLLLYNSTKAEKLESVKEFLISVSNFNLQINKKLEFEKNNIGRPDMNPSQL